VLRPGPAGQENQKNKTNKKTLEKHKNNKLDQQQQKHLFFVRYYVAFAQNHFFFECC